jgi:hypothetical protein
VKLNEASIPESGVPVVALDKSFGFSKHFSARYKLGRRLGTTTLSSPLGQFGHSA